MKVVIDTCVVLDALQNREPFYEKAQELILHMTELEFTGVLTAKSITDIYYLLRKSLHNDLAVRSSLRKLYTIFDVVDTFANDCELAIYSETADYEDAVMIETAKRIGADYIVTRNQKDYAKSEISVYSPEEFLEMLNDEQANIRKAPIIYQALFHIILTNDQNPPRQKFGGAKIILKSTVHQALTAFSA